MMCVYLVIPWECRKKVWSFFLCEKQEKVGFFYMDTDSF